MMKLLSKTYPVWLSDIWGVVHNGVTPFASAVTALKNHRANGGTVILISNAPNTAPTVAQHLDKLGVDKNAYDNLVTSGDATRNLIIKHGGEKTYFIGTSRDLSIFKGLDIARVSIDQAQSVVVTGLFNELEETAADYATSLAEIKQRNLTMICANPDMVVQKGDILIPCAGALAHAYEKIGGKVLMAGKPFTPIYDLAISKAQEKLGHAIDKSQILCIGDGPHTDIKGAADLGVPCVFITDGINSSDDIVAETKKTVPHANIIAHMPELDWH
jgi:HAD superfamily hydrolase (TIGR01459 family)